jgi:hypothetical protein
MPRQSATRSGQGAQRTGCFSAQPQAPALLARQRKCSLSGWNLSDAIPAGALNISRDALREGHRKNRNRTLTTSRWEARGEQWRTRVLFCVAFLL